ncbi:hypothetical protein LQW54_004326 [Pestalotiopsis sp. IQ-011]
MSPSLDKSADFRNTFFQYAARHWSFHFRESGDQIDTELLHKAVSLCHPVGKNLAWLTSYDEDLNWSNWPDLKTAAFFGLGAAVRAIIDEGGVGINATGGKYGTALYAASREGFQGVVNILLDHGADVNMGWFLISPIYVAIAAEHYAVVQLLFDKCTDRIEISMAGLLEAAYRFTQEEAEGLLKSLTSKIMLTPQSLTAACKYSRSRNAWTLLAKYRGKEIQVTPEMIVMAARNEYAGSDVMAQLLEAWNDQIEITPEVLHAAAQNQFAGHLVMDILLRELQRRQVQIEVNEEILIAAATNRIGHIIVLQLFEWTRTGNQVTPWVVAAAPGNEFAGVPIMGLLFEKKGFQIEITPDVILAAEMNRKQGKWVLELIEIFHQSDKEPELILQEIAERQAQLMEERLWRPRSSFRNMFENIR